MQSNVYRTTVQTPARSKARWRLVAQHRDRLMRIAHRRVPNPYDAEDCVHEALIRAVVLERLDDQRVGEFLTSTLLRICFDLRRQTARVHQSSSRLCSHTAIHHPEELACQLSVARQMLQAAAALRGREHQLLHARSHGSSTAPPSAGLAGST
jgi:RNA polymerase sigma-70 factor (ECF subfamily)